MKKIQIDMEPKHLALVMEILEQHVPGKSVWAYGSRVNGKATKRSDLDIVVFEADSNSLGDLREAFEESDLPFSVDVMDWGSIPEKFRENILMGYVILK